MHARSALLSLFTIAVLSACATAQDLPAPLPKLELQDGDSIVFLGDSITHQCLYTQYVEDYFYTRMPKVRLKLHNAGVGGARAWDALARFDKDVAAYQPKYVTILLGMNDGSYQPYNQAIFDTYRTDMTTLLGRLKEIGATPIPMTPTMFDSRAARARDTEKKRDPESTALYNSVLTYYGTWLREQAVENGYGFVDMWGPLNNITLEARKTDPAFTLIVDAVHPDAPGQVVMATAIIADLGLPRRVSSIALEPGADGQPTARTSGGTLTDLQWGDGVIEFTWQADCLPWVLPEDAALGAKLTRLGHRLGQESLSIHGLPAGKYTLSIDGQEVGTYSHAQLGRRVELQENAETPQYQQALAIANLNKQRNEGPVQALRGEWGRFQGYARTKRTVTEQPDNAQAKDALGKLEPQMEGMDQRVAEHIAAAKVIEDDIFTKNTPPARKYRLQREE